MLASGDASVADRAALRGAVRDFDRTDPVAVSTGCRGQYGSRRARQCRGATVGVWRITAPGERNVEMTGGGIGSAAKERQAHALAAQQLEERKAAAEAAAKAAKAAASAGAKGAKSGAAAAKKEASAEASAAKKAASAEAKAQADAAREAEQLQKAQDELLSDEERLAVFRQRLAAGGLPEVERLG